MVFYFRRQVTSRNFHQVMFTTPVIPPDPAGEFKNIKYVGNATVVPEPGIWLLMLSGLGIVAAFGTLRNSRYA